MNTLKRKALAAAVFAGMAAGEDYRPRTNIEYVRPRTPGSAAKRKKQKAARKSRRANLRKEK